MLATTWPKAANTILRSGCKVNLFLDITALRADGRHELRTLFWPLAEPHDELSLLFAEAGSGFRLLCNAPEVDPVRNTLCSAWTAFAAATGYAPDLVLELKKNVPMGAGLGGGSANAAALLLWLNAQAPVKLSQQEMIALAASVGADVPFFLHNCPALGTGIGEILQPCPEASLYAGLTLLLVCPAINVSTGAAFQAFDNRFLALISTGQGELFSGGDANSGLTKFAEPDKEIHSLCMSRIVPEALAVHHVRNSLEAVVFDIHPELSFIKIELVRLGASATGMSGSGASLFGLFRESSTAQRAAQAVQGPGVSVWLQQLRL